MVNARKAGCGTLTALAVGGFFSGGCTEKANRFSRDMVVTGIQQAVVSGVRTEIEGPRSSVIYVGSQSQPNVVKTPEGSYFDITPDGIRHTVVPGVMYSEYVKEHKEEFPNGYFVQVHDAGVPGGYNYTVKDKDFVDLSK